MTRITVHAVHADGERRRWTLSERIATENLDSEHYTAQLLEGVRWATPDAEALESPSADLNADPDDDARRTPLRTGSRGDRASRHSGTRPLTGGRAVTT
jgi:hypothetical protein